MADTCKPEGEIEDLSFRRFHEDLDILPFRASPLVARGTTFDFTIKIHDVVASSSSPAVLKYRRGELNQELVDWGCHSEAKINNPCKADSRK